MISSRSARHGKIIEILRRTRVTSQAQLSRLLEEEEGIATTQATLSRDLDELGARKVRSAEGSSFYVVSGIKDIYGEESSAAFDKLRRMIDELVVAIDHSGPIAVLRTPPGAGQFLASYVDRVEMEEIVGCIAGDDTIFVLAREPLSGKDLVERMRAAQA
ncbi:arginine repressor [Corynebacterium tapiri]|uniref:Arginine repressor n=1 Tax=Corynebacterium tapiri TaxID=1448266 RepID=A0A5C4U628_9CORY|nr:arginine repressor [Corynebacterium tapiri]TNL99850.1 arginine repressor [Corynebacterium tapiri]